MSDDDPIGKRKNIQLQDPFAQLQEMMGEVPNMAKLLNSRVRIELDITPDEGIQILSLLKDIRK